MSKNAKGVERILVLALEERWRIYRNHLKRCRRSPSEEPVHDLRVAARRLIAALNVVSSILPEADTKATRREMKKVLAACGVLRDVHVQMMTVEEMVMSHPSLQSFLMTLKQRKRQLSQRVTVMADRVEIKATQKRITRVMRIVEHRSRRVNESSAVRIAGAAFAKANDLRSRINPEEPRTIHAFRVAFKKFRYLVEVLSPILGVTKRQLKAMDEYQTRLGAIQDADVLMQSADAYAERRQAAVRESMTLLRRELGEKRRKCILEFMKSPDVLEKFREMAWATETAGKTSPADKLPGG